MNFVKLILLTIPFYVISDEIISIPKAKAQFNIDKNYTNFEHHKQKVKDYYEHQYHNDLQEICQNALLYFLSIKRPENAVIIFDVDDTVMSHYHFYKEKNFEWTVKEIHARHHQLQSKAIKPILEFYIQLIKNKFKIIFITARRSCLKKATYQNLIQEGYTNFEDLILFPIELRDKGVKAPVWKANTREEVSKKYNIIGSFSDLQEDFEGGHTGKCFKLPNYLY
ncbi:MAG: HAD family acid phosphatase [Candidatus Babeliales bacterium]|nr:HAD family acid phosphatase [Candidatus Babeliales bacterium]